jgi:hypothetical protein
MVYTPKRLPRLQDTVLHILGPLAFRVPLGCSRQVMEILNQRRECRIQPLPGGALVCHGIVLVVAIGYSSARSHQFHASFVPHERDARSFAADSALRTADRERDHERAARANLALLFVLIAASKMVYKR